MKSDSNRKRTGARELFLAGCAVWSCAWMHPVYAEDDAIEQGKNECLVAETDSVMEAQIAAAVHAQDAVQGEHYRIVLQYLVLRRSNGTGGFTNLALIDEHLRDLNWGFRDTPFVFVRVPGVKYIDSDDYYSLDNVDEAHQMYSAYYTSGVVNIFMHDGTLFNNPNARTYTSPGPRPRRGHTYGDTRIGLPANIAYSPHELGHFFFLLHPYESSFAGTECVARDLCLGTGDLVCDTPASPAVFQQNTLRTGAYFGTAKGPCPGDAAYAPLTDLWMEAGWQYGDPGALIRNRFTEGQVERMVATLKSLSQDLVGSARPDILVDCDADGADDIDAILAGTVPDINEDKVPDSCQAFLRNGDLLVTGMTNSDTNALRFFDPLAGAFRGVLRTGAWYGHQVRTGPDGLVYMTSLSVIQQLDPHTGRLVSNLVDGSPEGAGTFTDILFDDDGNLLVLDISRQDIKRYSRDDGSFLGTFAVVPLSSPKYMEYGPDGNIYLVGNGTGDNRVARIDAQTGENMGDFVAAGSGGLLAGQGLEFHGGYLYVSDGAQASVLRYDAVTGAFDREFVVQSDNGGLSNPHGLRFGPDGNLYVASRGNNAVKRYSGNNGAYLDDFVPAGTGGPPGTGTIEQPAGLLFSKVGSGSTEPEINPGMNGAWANLKTLGQGILFDVAASQNQLVMGWFTYEARQEEGDVPGGNTHRWLVGAGPYSGNMANLELLAVDGGTFNGPDAVTNSEVGTAIVRFKSCTEAEFEYAFNSGLNGSMILTRLLPDVLCEKLSKQAVVKHD